MWRGDTTTGICHRPNKPVTVCHQPASTPVDLHKIEEIYSRESCGWRLKYWAVYQDRDAVPCCLVAMTTHAFTCVFDLMRQSFLLADKTALNDTNCVSFVRTSYSDTKCVWCHWHVSWVRLTSLMNELTLTSYDNCCDTPTVSLMNERRH